MPSLASMLMAASSFVILGLGCAHLFFTFRGNKFYPRDAELMRRLQEVSPMITRETTMWKAWVGFNASHSFGAILFGLVFGYLSLMQPDVLFASGFLLGVGLTLLAGYVFLGWRYWFRVPFHGIVFSTALYVAALLARWA